MWYGIIGNAKSKIALDAARSCHVADRTVRFPACASRPSRSGGRRTEAGDRSTYSPPSPP